ncbi:MAG: NADH-ubiquinone oxidoreductase-F iron-sulfur binding region domain-containing protein [Dehalococcoidia bacterium]|nr:NADH-ubiquinone oxidoreductase-F iron-sulfur binding region domain-containing protein [Dehalococcoidia bacterium]
MTIQHTFLEAIRQESRRQPISKLFIHKGTCGMATDIVSVCEELGIIDMAMSLNAEIIETSCDGRCWAAPSVTVQKIDDAGAAYSRRFDRIDLGIDLEEFNKVLDLTTVHNVFDDGVTGLASRFGQLDGSLLAAVELGAYSVAEKVFLQDQKTILSKIETSKLSGRGGAHFPTGLKWKLAAQNAGPRYLVVNAEEGEPGVFKDRHLLEADPHRLIEGILICCYAVGVEKAFVYVNGQAHKAIESLLTALDQAKNYGILGSEFLPEEMSVDIEVRAGAGGYVCGEESVILNSIEGERPVPRFKPPFATDQGLWGMPTVINNVETLAAVTTLWQDSPPPTKLVSLSGNVTRPGVYEVPADGTLSWNGFLLSAGAELETVPALLLGGPSGIFLPRDKFEERIEMKNIGAGGIFVLSPESSVREITNALAGYNERESCGECTPCREGTIRLTKLLQQETVDLEKVEELIEVMEEASLCMLGGMAGRPVKSAIENFPATWISVDR